MDYDKFQMNLVGSIDACQKGLNLTTPPGGWKRYTKFTGDVACRAIQFYLNEHFIDKTKFKVVGPNAWIQTLSNELDLLIVRKDAEPMQFSNLYPAKEVIAAIEVKTNGVFSIGALDRQVKLFDDIKKRFPQVDCLYISLSETAPKKPTSQNYVKITRDKLESGGNGVFIFRNTRTKEYFPGELEKLVNRIKEYR